MIAFADAAEDEKEEDEEEEAKAGTGNAAPDIAKGPAFLAASAYRGDSADERLLLGGLLLMITALQLDKSPSLKDKPTKAKKDKEESVKWSGGALRAKMTNQSRQSKTVLKYERKTLQKLAVLL